MKRFATRFALTASALLMGAFSAPAATIEMSKEQVKELASTAAAPADHLKLAAWYNSAADRFEAEAREHWGLADTYRGQVDVAAKKNPMSGRTTSHCEYFAK